MELNELKAILDNAPEGATHFSGRDYYCLEIKYTPITEHYKWFVFSGGVMWDDVGDMYLTEMNDIQSLSDIRTIVEQAEEIERLEIATDNSKVNAALIEENERLKAALNSVANWDKATKEEVDSCVEVLKSLTPPEGK